MKDPATARVGPKALPDAVLISEAKDEDEVVPAPTVKSYKAVPEKVEETA